MLANAPSSLPSPYFREEHEQLRAQVRRFVETEIKPHGLKWEEQGYVPREVLRRMGELGFLGIRYPAEYGGSRDGHARLGRARRGAWPLHLRRRRHHRAGAHRHGLGAHGERRLAGAEGALDAGDHRRPRNHRRRRDRAGRRLRREGHPHHGAPRRRPLRAQRRQDVHHQRRACRHLFRRREDVAGRAALAADLDVHGRERHAGLLASAARSTSTAGAPPTPRSSRSRTAAFRRKTCSARKAAASTPS